MTIHAGRFKPIDITGQVFGALTAVHPTQRRTGTGGIMWRCRCQCGKERLACTADLRSGSVKSCGCAEIRKDKRKATRFDEVLGQLLKERRKARGLSQVSVCKQTGMTYQNVQKYEAGVSRMPVCHLFDIAAACGFEPADFIADLAVALKADSETEKAA